MMRKLIWLFPVITLLLLSACQTAKRRVMIFDGDEYYSFISTARLPSVLLDEAGLTLNPTDRVLYLGSSVGLDQPLPPSKHYNLHVCRAIELIFNSPQGQQIITTSARTVGEALVEAGFSLYATDRIEPPAETPITANIRVDYQPARALIVKVGGNETQIRSAALTIGQALAEASLPLLGSDYSLPSESDPLPNSGEIQVMQVVEEIILNQRSISFNSRFEPSADLELDQQAILQGGETGLAYSRTRVSYANGEEITREIEGENIVRPALDRIIGYGTRIVIHTAVVDGITIEYWRTLTLAVTTYSPCRSGVPQCLYGTSSGTPVRRGAVAMVRSWYLLMKRQQLYIPIYGYASIEDVGAGWPAGNHYWVDLGYSEEEYEVRPKMPLYTIVYFLTPVPASIPYILP